MFGRKRLCEKQAQLIDLQSQKLTQVNNWLGEYLEVLKNIKALDTPQSISIGLYTQNEDIYQICVENIFVNPSYETVAEFDLFTYNLNSYLSNYDNFITKSQIEIHKIDSEYIMELVNIDTRKELRKRHASRQLEKIIFIGKLLKVSSIYGELWDETYIGINNLKHFYQKNGFTVYKDSFFMKLK